ncbi:hypothetical protein KY290_025112 [Solanum tuberosum]|uniref:Ubiquitin n=1 Tax=Solanum tuberosum TaxID=4113 RepID=A0ABQ7USL6_SOLTU|nr:hypothetical protein KY284_037388 [Solanum tuberosum]KAH0637698.1 hypothetical protein KY289_037613 [Solanum tuberosum]KAH0640764.1 hypothetical protein KY285_037350 [Solanum tuberosum]KAH0672874.1 hypothetical protein KY284_023961 [Solanum tuberosum]KAH0754842.1 hypothetical protein KY290_025112 [Solanum tuberosum]
MIAGKGQTKQRLFQSGESIQEKGIKLHMNNSRFQTSFKEAVTASVHVTGTTLGNGEAQHDNEDLLNFKQVKRKSVRPATTIDLFLDKQQIHNEHDIHDPIINEHNKGLDDLVDQEELGRDKCDVEEEIDIDCSTKEISKSKKVRGQTTCKDIHARNLEERNEVAFDKGQAVGPTNKIVSQLSNFIGTIARNPRFISLMYTSWHVVPKDTKKRMWEYINSKFLIPVEGKKWVMTGLRDAWRRHKQKIKENFFDKNSTLEDMLAKRPDGIRDNQFRQLIEYWKHPTVQRAAKDNNEEPSKPEMFIATRTKTGKEIQVDTQVAIAELQNRQNSGETADDAFRAVFGKEQPGRLRCYGRSVTTSSLKKNEEINNLKQKHVNEITSLKEELREEMRHLFTQLLQNNPGLNFQDIRVCVGSNLASPIDASSAQAVRGTNLPHSSGSAHDSVLQKLYECCIVLNEDSTDFGL